jgi:hypothetical protein
VTPQMAEHLRRPQTVCEVGRSGARPVTYPTLHGHCAPRTPTSHPASALRRPHQPCAVRTAVRGPSQVCAVRPATQPAHAPRPPRSAPEMDTSGLRSSVDPAHVELGRHPRCRAAGPPCPRSPPLCTSQTLWRLRTGPLINLSYVALPPEPCDVRTSPATSSTAFSRHPPRVSPIRRPGTPRRRRGVRKRSCQGRAGRWAPRPRPARGGRLAPPAVAPGLGPRPPCW